MKLKKAIAYICIVLLLVAGGLLAFFVFQNPTVPDVVNIGVTDSDESTISLKWGKEEVDGYIIYMVDADKGPQQLATIDNFETTEYVVKDLDEAQRYSFFINAFKTRRSKIFESENHEVIDAFTVPVAQTINSIEADAPGALHVEWNISSKAVGYQLQYVKGKTDDFSAATTVEIEENIKAAYDIQKLGYGATCSVRVRSYAMFKKSRVYGGWSEVKTAKTLEKQVDIEGIDKSKPMIALTFDDGPGYNKVSDQILDVLEKYNVKATFFMVGENAADHPENLKRKVKLGMEIGNHTYNHEHYGNKVTAGDIRKASDAIYKACGKRPTAFRSPGGSTTQIILDECKKEKMVAYYWSIDTLDWKNKDADKIYNIVMNNVSDGDIILMHELYPSTAKAVEKMVPELIKKGYQIVTCEQLVRAKTGKNPKYGNQYVDGDTVNNKTY